MMCQLPYVSLCARISMFYELKRSDSRLTRKGFSRSRLKSRSFHFILLMEEILYQLIGIFSMLFHVPHCLQGFIHPRWCRISSINSIILFLSHKSHPSLCQCVGVCLGYHQTQQQTHLMPNRRCFVPLSHLELQSFRL